jgi:hypothetical protein
VTNLNQIQVNPTTLEDLKKFGENDPDYQSKWGYHPCNYPTFQKLKRLHKLFWQNQLAWKARLRWERKQPQNRRGPRPIFIPSMVPPLVRTLEKGKRPNPEGHQIRILYQAARKPSPTPVPLFDKKTLEYIKSLEGLLK